MTPEFAFSSNSQHIFLGEFQDQKVKAVLQEALSQKISNNKLLLNKREYYVLPSDHDITITTSIKSKDYYNFVKTYNIRKSTKKLIINDLLKKSDYWHLHYNIDKSLMKKPYIWIKDLGSEVMIDYGKLVSEYCNMSSGKVTQKYIDQISYHKEPLVREDLYKYAKKLYDDGKKYKPQFTAYCDIKAKDYYPFKGDVKIEKSSWRNSVSINFYLPLVLAKNASKSYYKIN